MMDQTIDKYGDTLKKYDFGVEEADVTKAVEEILKKDFDKNNTKEVYKKLYSCIDLTTLKETDTRESVYKFVDGVNKFDGSTDIPNVASICVFPNMVPVVKDTLTADVKICSVAGGFPASQTFQEIKVAEVAMARAAGADEIDIVFNLGCFYDGNYQELSEEISEIKDLCKENTLKVILETGVLKNPVDIMKASILSMYSGANFIKTSTGKTEIGATLEAVYCMAKAIKQYSDKTNIKIGLKASGGISTTEEAVQYYTVVTNILGEEYANNKLFRIGASRLAKNLVESINSL